MLKQLQRENDALRAENLDLMHQLTYLAAIVGILSDTVADDLSEGAVAQVKERLEFLEEGPVGTTLVSEVRARLDRRLRRPAEQPGKPVLKLIWDQPPEEN